MTALSPPLRVCLMTPINRLSLLSVLMFWTLPLLAEEIVVRTPDTGHSVSQQTVIPETSDDNTVESETGRRSAQAEKEGDTTQKVERFILPATRWIEQTVRKTPLIRSPEKPDTSPVGQIDLRTAIKQALRVYPGTVLNAEKSRTEGRMTYRVRIISAQGVVKTIAVSNTGAEGEKAQ